MPIVFGVLLMLIVTFIEPYLSIFMTFFIFIFGSFFLEIICRIFFKIGFFRTIIPAFFFNKK